MFTGEGHENVQDEHCTSAAGVSEMVWSKAQPGSWRYGPYSGQNIHGSNLSRQKKLCASGAHQNLEQLSGSASNQDLSTTEVVDRSWCTLWHFD